MGSRVSRSTSRTSAMFWLASPSVLAFRFNRRTSLCDFCKSQTCTSLQVYVVGKDECAQRPKWLAREEVGLSALLMISILHEC